MKHRKHQMKNKKYKKRTTPPEVYGYIPERDQVILGLSESGETLQSIGDKYKITRERVRQIMSRALRKRIKSGLKTGTYENPEHKRIKELVKEEIQKIKTQKAETRVQNKLQLAKTHGLIPEKFTSRLRFAESIGIGLAAIEKFAPETLELIRENTTLGMGGKRWSRFYLMCRMCNTSITPHHSHGYCERCFSKTEIFKEMQASSRLRNQHRWKPRQEEYLREYYDKKKYGGNKKKAREKDEYKCTICGMSEERSKELYGEQLRVLHLHDVNDNNLTNLSTFCRSCSMKYLRSKRSKHGDN